MARLHGLNLGERPGPHIPEPTADDTGQEAPDGAIAQPDQPGEAPADPPPDDQAGGIDVGLENAHDRELTDLRATIALYEAERAARSNLPESEPLRLFLDPNALDRIREAAVAARGTDRRLVLPDVVPRYKASALDLAVPPKVEEAFKAYKYVPYIALTHSARLRVARGEEDF